MNPSSYDFEIAFNLAKERNSIGSAVDVLFYITCKNSSFSSLLREMYIEHQGSSYFCGFREYLKGSSYISTTMHVYASANIDTFPGILSFSLCTGNGKVVTKQNFILHLNRFTAELFKNPNQSRNLLLFGLAGSSKSSFINSAYSLLSREVQHELAQSGGHETRVTTEFKSYRLIDINTKETTPYRIWDTWGMESDNYASCEFQYILEGRLASKTQMNSGVFRLGSKNLTPQNIEAIPHCVIFFIPVTELDNEESLLLQKTREFMQKTTEYKVSSVLALAKMDAAVPLFRENGQISPQITQKINRASQIFNLSPNRIIPLINYLSESERSITVDRGVFKLLTIASKVADSGSLKTLPSDIQSLLDS